MNSTFGFWCITFIVWILKRFADEGCSDGEAGLPNIADCGVSEAVILRWFQQVGPAIDQQTILAPEVRGGGEGGVYYKKKLIL